MAESKKDDRIFKPDWKACVAKNKFYTFRFLPDPEGNPFVHFYTHAFQYPNADGSGKKWYINNCASTFDWDSCPICKKNSEYYDSAYESDKKLAKARGRKQHWMSNILMVNDPINPENNGKVFLYDYGYMVYQKIEKQMFPSEVDLEDQDFEEFTPFDLFEGADFKFKIKMKGEYPNYEDSAWSKCRPVAKDDDELDTIMEGTYLLTEFLDPKRYPKADEVIKQVGHLLGVAVVADEEPQEESEEEPQEEPVEESAQETPVEETPVETTPESEPDAELDDDEAFFNNLKK